ncbi:hypothetical protein [Pseudovibrio sp. SCP19]|uniref:hypothetical protein n=1 Tax=Pseudovibrio sp. SCP19 TaxID=3141374 RepID=UPI0033369E67
MFSRKTRKGLLGGVALALAGLMAGEAGADDAALASGKNRALLIDQRICKNVNVAIAIEWARKNNYGSDIFYMTPEGAFYGVNTGKYMHDYKDFMVLSHGSPKTIGGIPNKTFAEHFYLTQDEAPNSMFFKSCSSAVAPDGKPSLLRYMQQQFKNSEGWTEGTKGIGVLSGAPGPCQLVPQAVMRYAGAEVRTGAERKTLLDFDAIADPIVRNAFQTVPKKTIRENITDKWNASGVFANGKDFKATCEVLIANVKNKRTELLEFIEDAIIEFGQEDQIPDNSLANMLTNYSYSKGGVANVNCGRTADCPSNE